MRGFKIFVLISITGLVFYSCDPCNNLDCITDNYDGQFRIVSATDGKDLVFGPDKIYDKGQIKFYFLKGADTTLFGYQSVKFPGPGYDSILLVRFFPETDTAYMLLSDGDVDTLTISYKTFDTKCCDIITEIKDFRFNNAVNIPGDNGTQEIKK